MIFIPEMAKDAKKFLKTYQAPLTFTAGVVAGMWCLKNLQDQLLEGHTQAIEGFVYEKGRDNGVVMLQNALLRDFVDHRGLRSEFFDYVKLAGGDRVETIEELIA